MTHSGTGDSTPDDERHEVAIAAEGDIVWARRAVREAAVELGFSVADVSRIVTASSELARNAFIYGGGGVVRWRRLDEAERVGIEVEFEDEGPGIADIDQAMEEGFTTAGGPGIGLPGARRLTDEMAIESELGQGTRVTIRKWRRL